MEEDVFPGMDALHVEALTVYEHKAGLPLEILTAFSEKEHARVSAPNCASAGDSAVFSEEGKARAWAESSRGRGGGHLGGGQGAALAPGGREFLESFLPKPLPLHLHRSS